MDKTAILVVSFGTTDEAAREKNVGAVERAAAALGIGAVRRAFTSAMVLRKLRQRGASVDTPAEALEKLREEGCRKVTVLPTFLAPGGEYRRLLDTVLPLQSRFERMEVLPPLMGKTAATSRLSEILQEHYRPVGKEAVLFMGHGTDGEGNASYRDLEEGFSVPGLYVALLKGEPGFEDTLGRILAAGHTGVRLVPLMLTAGTHAAEQMTFDDPDSWASRCAAAGLKTRWEMTGLGELEAVRKLYVAELVRP